MRHRWGVRLKPVPSGARIKQKCVKCDMIRLTFGTGKETFYEFKRGNRYIEKPGPLGEGTPPCEGKMS